jgi:hypothetical protein
MATLRQQAKLDDPSPRSDSITPSTLSTFLLIYSKAIKECYIDYMTGAETLHDWLTCNRSVPLDFQVDKFPEIEDKEFKVPALLSGYESHKLAEVITGSWESYSSCDVYFIELARVNRAIYLTMSKEVIYELY